jgi:N utilization substance protein B
MSRRTARRHAFHLVFSLPFYSALSVEDLAEKKAYYYDGLEMDERPDATDNEYIDRAVWGVFDNQREIDGVIENFLRDWTLDRIAKVDLAIMRLAVYEMLREEDVPLAVATNEAVEIAKEYGTDDAPAFVNGVLASVARELKNGLKNG